MTNPHMASFEPLFDTIVHLQSVEECAAFFEDLCTIRELKDISQRLEVAQLLDAGFNYQEVAAKTGVSSTTISRVKRCLEYGSGGYRTVLDRMKENEK